MRRWIKKLLSFLQYLEKWVDDKFSNRVAFIVVPLVSLILMGLIWSLLHKAAPFWSALILGLTQFLMIQLVSNKLVAVIERRDPTARHYIRFAGFLNILIIILLLVVAIGSWIYAFSEVSTSNILAALFLTAYLFISLYTFIHHSRRYLGKYEGKRWNPFLEHEDKLK